LGLGSGLGLRVGLGLRWGRVRVRASPASRRPSTSSVRRGVCSRQSRRYTWFGVWLRVRVRARGRDRAAGRHRSAWPFGCSRSCADCTRRAARCTASSAVRRAFVWRRGNPRSSRCGPAGSRSLRSAAPSFPARGRCTPRASASWSPWRPASTTACEAEALLPASVRPLGRRRSPRRRARRSPA
jgi:hypothetical protein